MIRCRRFIIKRILLLILLFITCIIKANEIEKVTYNNGELVLSFTEKINKYQPKYDSSTYLLQIDIDNVKSNKKIKSTMEIADNLIDTIIIDNNNSKASIVIYAMENINYIIEDKNDKKLKIKITPYITNINKKTIILDAGHGGKDPGAIGNGVFEKDLAFKTIMKLKELLENDYNVILTRDDDYFVTLTDRAKIANDNNSDLFVSIHLNASKRAGANGTEAFYFSKNPDSYANEIAKYENSFDIDSAKAIESSKFLLNDITYHSNQVISAALAKDVVDNLVGNITPLTRRGIFGANFAVLRGTKSPAILIELGFVTNKSDANIFSDEKNQIKAAKAIADAIKKNFK